MKKILIFLLIAMTSVCASAQTKVSGAQLQQLVEKIDKAAASMTSMQCDFVQTKKMKMLSKEMKSTGVMYFKRPSKLRWQYTTPYDYTFLLNGDKVRIKSTKTTQDINVQQNKMFRQITNVIVSSITGGSLTKSAEFTSELLKNNNQYFVRLVPKKKEIKQIFSNIEVYFNTQLTMVSSVKMTEKTGDVTVVELKNTKLNATISDKTFDIN